MKKEESNENEFLQELSPTLFDKRISSKPSPPEGYFDGIADSVMSKIEAGENRKRSGKLIRLVNYRNIAIAAGIAMILAVIPYFNSQTTHNTGDPEIAAITIPDNIEIDDLTAYVNEDELYSALDDDHFKDLSINEAITEDQIIEYLILEGVNDELLIETRQ